MPKFHILEVQEEKGTFREVEGEAVEIEGISAFVRNSDTTGSLLDCWTISDVMTGVRLSQVCGTRNGAVRSAESRMNERGVERWREEQKQLVDDFGPSPSAPSALDALDALDAIQVICEPQVSGEIQPCSRETHCSHH